MEKTYKVISPVDHDKHRHEIGGTIDLEDKDAAGLLAVGAIEPAGSSATAAPADEAARIAAIAEAIGGLDTADASLWMKSGAPKTDAITAITGWPVAGKERDAAWAQFGAGK